jgi:hypothetical protein
MITIQRYKNYLIIQIYLTSFLPNRIPNPVGPNFDGDRGTCCILFGIVIHMPIKIAQFELSKTQYILLFCQPHRIKKPLL